MQAPQRSNAPASKLPSENNGSGTVYFHIFNGRKYCVVDSNNALSLVEVTDNVAPNMQAMWQMIQDDKGNFSFKNRFTGGAIIFDGTNIQTSSSTGDNSKWTIVPATNLSIDECMIVKTNNGEVFANNSEILVLKTATGPGLDVTQYADQLFKIVYAGSSS